MKKLLSVILLIAAIMTLSVFADDVKPVTVTLNGAIVDCASYGQEATIVDGRTLVPLRAIFDALGATVEWDKETETVTSVLGQTEISITIGESKLLKNGEEIPLDVPAQIMNGRTLVPVRAISDSFGVAVDWDGETRTVILMQFFGENEVADNSENTDNVPEQAKQTAEKFFDALIKMELTTAAEYCDKPETLKQINISGYEDLLALAGMDRETLSDVFFEQITGGAEYYREYCDALADVTIDISLGFVGKMDYEIVSYTALDDGRIKVEYKIYSPDTDKVSMFSETIISQAIDAAYAEILSESEEFALDTEEDVVHALSVLVKRHAASLIEQELLSVESYSDGSVEHEILVNVNGVWLIEVTEEDISEIEQIVKNGWGFVGE